MVEKFSDNDLLFHFLSKILLLTSGYQIKDLKNVLSCHRVFSVTTVFLLGKLILHNCCHLVITLLLTICLRNSKLIV